ncbi:glycosyltransferase [Mycoplasma sp. NEAQ87857]|uniref:glycosyltransferase n=1 Tax=Mycoplasma sp. NEAQ87857 TaxID=2683967 RepID=UPI00131BA64A|nr:glycosyltransferase [Mycoplasma sp. NEAQ87857]
MKLSIISLVGESARDVRNYLQDLKEQENQDFEVILFINNKKEAKNIFAETNSFFDFFKNRLNIVFNTKNNSYQVNLINAFKMVKGDFVTVINSDTSLKKTYIQKIIDQAQNANVDVLEFRPRIIGTIRYKPKTRIKSDIAYKTSDNPSIVAYTHPFIFNKVFKRSLVSQMSKYKVVNSNDSKLCIGIMYLLMLNAKTYMYLDYRIWREYFDSNIWFNSKNFLNEFSSILQYINTKDIKRSEEVIYAKYYFLKILLTAFLTETSFMYKKFKYFGKDEINEKRSALLQKKHIELITKTEQSSEYEKFISTNIYMLKNNDETNLLIKPVKTINKNKILSNLE